MTMIDDELDLIFLNLEFRMLLLEEALKDARERTNKLLLDVEGYKKKYLETNDEEDYWRAD
jgi:hypothetical protein